VAPTARAIETRFPRPEEFTNLNAADFRRPLARPRCRWPYYLLWKALREGMDLEHEEPWLRATITYLRMVIPIVANPRAEASLQKLAECDGEATSGFATSTNAPARYGRAAGWLRTIGQFAGYLG
jgi:hypothetical protein